MKPGQEKAEVRGLLREVLWLGKQALTDLCLAELFSFFLAEGAWERPARTGLLTCFSWGPRRQRKNRGVTSSQGPAQGKHLGCLDPE